MPPCCCSARPAPARSCSPGRFTSAARAATRPFVVVNCAALPGQPRSRASCSAASAARSPARTRRRSAASSWPTAARCSSTRSASCRSNCSRSCCACCRKGRSSASAARGRSTSTCGSSPPPTATSPKKCGRAGSASDLYYRLNVFPITLPSLRDRREDIPLLVRHLVRTLSRALQQARSTTIPPHVMRALERYDWPGNIRELENVLQRAIILSPGPTLTLGDAWMPALPAAPAGGA